MTRRLPGPAAYSADGYIVRQEHTGALRYGLLSSATNGCGWIAAFNFMRAMGRPAPEAGVCRALAAGSPFKCLLGTGPGRLKRFLEAQGFALAGTARRPAMPALASAARAGILFYFEGAEPHFVAFAAAEKGKLRFFNAAPGEEDITATMAGFLARRAKFPAVYLMVNTSRRKGHYGYKG